MKKLEIVLAILILVGFFMTMLQIVLWATIMVLSLLTLSILYYFLGFALFNDIRLNDIFNKEAYKGKTTLRIFGAICSGIGISTLLMGALFKIQRWPLGNANFFSGLVLTIIIIVFALFRFQKSQDKFYKNILLRAFIAIGFGTFFYLVSLVRG